MSGLEGGRRRILVVDDDRAIRELVSTYLTQAGYDAFGVRDGCTALARLASLRPAAMVLDLSMPDMDGFDVLERMGKAGTSMTPTLVLTARHNAVDVKRAVGLGARDYLTKPFSSSQLLARVARLLRRPAGQAGADEAGAPVEHLLD